MKTLDDQQCPCKNKWLFIIITINMSDMVCIKEGNFDVLVGL